jgi:hypothetical protein
LVSLRLGVCGPSYTQLPYTLWGKVAILTFLSNATFNCENIATNWCSDQEELFVESLEAVIIVIIKKWLHL